MPDDARVELFEWLKVAKEITDACAGTPDTPPFSGYSSLELEAARTIAQVIESYRRLLDGN
jgi:hypothetical protein